MRRARPVVPPGSSAHPPEGLVVQVPTPAGLRFYKVFKSNAERSVLVPLSSNDVKGLVAHMMRQEALARAWGTLGRAVAVVAAHERLRRWPRWLARLVPFPRTVRTARRILDVEVIEQECT